MSDEKKAQQGFYARPEKDDESECPSCFYQPAAAKADEQKTEGAAEDGECPSCFYQPEKSEESMVDDTECPSCFYQPGAKEN